MQGVSGSSPLGSISLGCLLGKGFLLYSAGSICCEWGVHREAGQACEALGGLARMAASPADLLPGLVPPAGRSAAKSTARPVPTSNDIRHFVGAGTDGGPLEFWACSGGLRASMPFVSGRLKRGQTFASTARHQHGEICQSAVPGCRSWLAQPWGLLCCSRCCCSWPSAALWCWRPGEPRLSPRNSAGLQRPEADPDRGVGGPGAGRLTTESIAPNHEP